MPLAFLCHFILTLSYLQSTPDVSVEIYILMKLFGAHCCGPRPYFDCASLLLDCYERVWFCLCIDCGIVKGVLIKKYVLYTT